MSRERTASQFVTSLIEKSNQEKRFAKEADKYKPRSGLMTNRNEPKGNEPVVDTAPKVMSSADHLYSAVEAMSKYVDDGDSDRHADVISKDMRISNIPSGVSLVDLHTLNPNGETDLGFLKTPMGFAPTPLAQKRPAEPWKKMYDGFMKRIRAYEKEMYPDDIKTLPDAVTDGVSDGKVTQGEGLMSRGPEFSPIDESIKEQTTTFYLDIGEKAEKDHGSTPVLTKDAKEKKKKDDEKSMDIGYGHKIHKDGEEDKSGKIYGIKYKNSDGTYIELSQDQKVEILNKDMAKNIKLAREAKDINDKDAGWDKKLKDIGTSWDELDFRYKNALASLAFNVGGKKAGLSWTAVLQAAKDEDVTEFAKELRRDDDGSRTEGMDNRVAKELFYSGLIKSLDELDLVWKEKINNKMVDRTSALPLVTANSGIPQSSTLAIPPVDRTVSGNTYIVEIGDTLSQIATDMGLGVDELINANPNVVPSRMQIGQVLNLPTAG